MPREPTLGLVHLVRQANGRAPLNDFLESYRRYRSGIAHQLVLVLKGFDDRAEIDACRALASDVSSTSIIVDDSGFDLGAYRAAALRLPHERLCFLNSFSQIESHGWLAALSDALALPGVGIAGATASWGSHRSMMWFDLFQRGAYAGLLDDPALVRRMLDLGRTPSGGPSSGASRLARRLATARQIVRTMTGFGSFPAPHVRTNAFLMERELFLQIRAGRLRDKLDTYRLESGPASLTNQIEALGRRSVVVGRDGQSYAPEEWPASRTFWQGEQENLLVSDNLTRAYRDGPSDRRAVLARFAWGSAAEPRLATPVVAR